MGWVGETSMDEGALQASFTSVSIPALFYIGEY